MITRQRRRSQQHRVDRRMWKKPGRRVGGIDTGGVIGMGGEEREGGTADCVAGRMGIRTAGTVWHGWMRGILSGFFFFFFFFFLWNVEVGWVGEGNEYDTVVARVECRASCRDQ